MCSHPGIYKKKHLNKNLACVAGGISVGVLFCFGGGAARRVGKSQFEISLRVAAPRPRTKPLAKESRQLRMLIKILRRKKHQENIKPWAVRGVLYYLVTAKREYFKSSLPLSCTAEVL